MTETVNTETLNILLVDDDRSVREALGGVLRVENFEVVPAGSAEEALREFLRQKIDVALLDLNLGDADGWETFAALLKLAPALPIIVMSGESRRLGHPFATAAAALFEKPFDPSCLVQKLRDVSTRQSHPTACNQTN